MNEIHERVRSRRFERDFVGKKMKKGKSGGIKLKMGNG